MRSKPTILIPPPEGSQRSSQRRTGELGPSWPVGVAGMAWMAWTEGTTVDSKAQSGVPRPASGALPRIGLSRSGAEGASLQVLRARARDVALYWPATDGAEGAGLP